MYRRKFRFDALNIILLVVAVLFMFLPLQGMNYFIAGILFALFMIRGYSGDVYAREQENAKVVNFFRSFGRRGSAHPHKKVKPVYRGQQTTQKADDTHKVFTCKKCKQKLRVPRGKGRILITCTNCGHKFTKKT